MTAMNINSGNRSVSNHLIPYNAMNINIITNSMLGKRKADKTIYERAKKRKDLSMIAEVGRITNDKVNIRLPKRIVDELKRINKMSSKERYEYAGKISFETSRTGSNEVKFNTPGRLTSQERGRVSGVIMGLIKDYYITYHTHPSATSKNNNDNTNNTRSRYFTLPSGADFEAYVKGYPGMQANIIADAYGYYVIDIIEAANREVRSNPKMINRAMEWIRSLNFLRSRLRVVDNYEYFESTLTEWKSAINTELNPYMLKHFGVSIKYYGYNDRETALVTLRRS
jgi:hypothetical protein